MELGKLLSIVNPELEGFTPVNNMFEIMQDESGNLTLTKWDYEISLPSPLKVGDVWTEELSAHFDEVYKDYTPVPSKVSMRQARLALLELDLLEIVKDAIEQGSDEVLKIEWEYATEVDRNWDNLIALTTTLGLTSTEVDNLFRLALTK